ncbi:MAG: DUF4157 domain-containing protein [Cyanobacteria bacterium P01_B01_bin.77]
MNTRPYKRSRKPPTTPEQERPFFSHTASHQPFFSTPKTTGVQPKLTVSKPNDPFEQEADAMARAVVNQTNTLHSTAKAENQIHRVSMKDEEPDQPNPELMKMEEEEAQTKPELMAMEEEEAQTKPELMRMEEEEAQTKPELMKMEEEEEAQTKPELMAMEEEEPQAKPELMRSATDSAQTKSSKGKPTKPSPEKAQKTPKDTLAQRLKQKKGMGQPLPAQTQKAMARAFKYDFSDVMIHTGDDAVQMTRELKAQAFTHGKDIYFNEGKYNPETSSGQELLAHELTHVVQQDKTS